MSDGHRIARLDRPVVVIVQRVFERAAGLQARALGAIDLPICAFTSPGPQNNPAQDEALGHAVAQQAMRMLAGHAPSA